MSWFKKKQDDATGADAPSGELGQFAEPVDPSLYVVADVTDVLNGDMNVPVEDIDGEFDEEDLMDPSLMAELNALQNEGQRHVDGPETDEALLHKLRSECENEVAAAVLFKQQGCIEEAKEMMPSINSLKKRIEELEDKLGIVRGPTKQQLDAASARMMEYKRAAIAWNRAGRKDRALQYLRVGKSIQEAIDAQNVEALTAKLPDLPETPSIPSAVVKKDPSAKKKESVETAEEIAVASAPPKPISAAKRERQRLRKERAAVRSNQFEVLEGKLDAQIRKCNELAKKFNEAGDKQSALLLFRRYKSDLAVLQKVKQIHAEQNIPVPEQGLETMEFRTPIEHSEIGDTEMEIEVSAGKHISHKKDGPFRSWIRLVFSYGNPDTVVESRVIGATENPVYNLKTRVTVTRKRSFQAWCERRNIRVELHHKHFFNSELVGKAYVDVSQLLTKCEQAGDYRVMEGKRQVGDMALTVRCCLRRPINGPEVRVQRVPLINVTKWLDAVEEEDGDDADDLELEPEILMEEMLKEPAAIGRLCSISVLKAELDGLGQISGNEKRMIELQNKLKLIEVMLQGAEVGDESLNFQDYSGMMKRKILEEKTLAKALSRAGRKPEALDCIKRAKRMTAEVKAINERLAKKTEQKESQPQKQHSTTPTEVITTGSHKGHKLLRVALSSDPHNSVHVISAAAMDWEMGLPGCTESRRALLEKKKEALIGAIQGEEIAMEEYADAVTRQVLQDRELYKQYLSQGKKELANYCLQRAKVMEQELNS